MITNQFIKKLLDKVDKKTLPSIQKLRHFSENIEFYEDENYRPLTINRIFSLIPIIYSHYSGVFIDRNADSIFDELVRKLKHIGYHNDFSTIRASIDLQKNGKLVLDVLDDKYDQDFKYYIPKLRYKGCKKWAFEIKEVIDRLIEAELNKDVIFSLLISRDNVDQFLESIAIVADCVKRFESNFKIFKHLIPYLAFCENPCKAAWTIWTLYSNNSCFFNYYRHDLTLLQFQKMCEYDDILTCQSIVELSNRLFCPPFPITIGRERFDILFEKMIERCAGTTVTTLKHFFWQAIDEEKNIIDDDKKVLNREITEKNSETKIFSCPEQHIKSREKCLQKMKARDIKLSTYISKKNINSYPDIQRKPSEWKKNHR